MAYFSDMSQLEKEIKKQSINALKDDVSRVIKDELKKQVLDKVYSHQPSNRYQRTYELLKSIEVGDVKEENGMYIAQVCFNPDLDRKSTRLNSSHANISYAVFCLKKKKQYVFHHTSP